jgi:hypothetical protein
VLKQDDRLFPEYDDRREIRRMLDRLGPRQRIQWLQWCCQQVSGGGVTTYVEKSSGEAADVFRDWATLCWGSGLTVRKSGDRLIQVVRGRV